MKLEPGTVFWITGLSGAGKSTLAYRVVEELRDNRENVVLIDGDEFRALHDDELGHDRADRLKNAFRISRLARFLSLQGIHVVCATMSLFKEVHLWNRENLQRLREIYILANIDELKRRDPKGLYRNGRNLSGVDLDFDPPESPDLLIENHGTAEELLKRSNDVIALLGGRS